MEPSGSGGNAVGCVRGRRRCVRLVTALVVLALLAPPAYSYTTTMMQPSSLSLWPRSVEWLRAHHGNWVVDEVEHYYYSWQAPDPGGPQLKSLPMVGVDAAPVTRAASRQRSDQHPPKIRPSSPIRFPARACGREPDRWCRDGRRPW